MSCGKDNRLTIASDEDLDRDAVANLAGSGSVYMCEVCIVTSVVVTILIGLITYSV